MVAIASENKTLKGRANFRICEGIAQFRNDETGAILIFALFLFIAMLMIGGMAVDFMRYEATRTHLQNTVDRAVLAAASMDQELDPTEVVKDYFDKAGLTDAATTIEVSNPNGARKVTANAESEITPFFLGLVGIDNLTAPATGTAEQSIGEVEISLVLDVSGSMGGSKLISLKTAAKDFVDTLFPAGSSSDGYSMSIIPYAGQVNVGSNLLSKYNAPIEHGYSSCVDFTDGQHLTVDLPVDEVIQHAGHFDPYSEALIGPNSYFICPTADNRKILALANDATTLRDYIDALDARGSTATNIGMKWGATLLDPSARPAIDALITDMEVDSSLSGRPFDHDTDSNLKVLVLMTDGVNSTGYNLSPLYDNGLSDIWYDAASGRYSVYNADQNLYYHADPADYTVSGPWDPAPFGGVDAVQLSYPELWAQVSTRYNARYNYFAMNNQNSATYTDWTNKVLGTSTSATKDNLMAGVCTAAKAQGIVIYTIGFQVSPTTAVKLENCATTVAHSFLIEDLDISDAFNAISGQIGRLRLSQ